MNTTQRNPLLIEALVFLAVDALVWLALPAELLLIVPRYHRVFVDFQMKLPIMTQIVLEFSAWFAEYWWTVNIPYLALVTGLVLVGLWLRGSSSDPFWRWLVLTLLLGIVLHALIWLVMVLPSLYLMEAFTR